MASKEESVQLLLARIEDGVKAVYESDNYRCYLAAMSKFHQYSYRNSILIFSQCPNATMVKGYRQWKTDFNRQVQMGEKGIQILCPAPKKITVKEKKHGPDGSPILDENGEPVFEKATKTIPRYITVYVFDISQTEGDPIPQPTQNLEGDFALYQDFLNACRTVSPFEIRFGELPDGTNGLCQIEPPSITIREGLSQAQTAKTLIHEIAHARMHALSNVDRRSAEIQAESVAFCVCDHYGLDTSDYSFPYLASWSASKELKELEASLETIQRNTFALTSELDEALKELSRQWLEERTHDEAAHKLGRSSTATVEEPAIPDAAGHLDNASQEATQAPVRHFGEDRVLPKGIDEKAVDEQPSAAEQANEFRQRLAAAQQEAARRAEEQRRAREIVKEKKRGGEHE